MEEVLDLLKDLRIAVAMMPASTTWRFQMIDVTVGKPFKDLLCDQWATWMLENCERRGVTAAGNFRHPTPTECNTWVTKAWEELEMSGVLKKAAELGMTPAPGPPVEGYVEKQFVDVQPEGEDEEYWYDLLHDVESEL